jgi:hypothetical protein
VKPVKNVPLARWGCNIQLGRQYRDTHGHERTRNEEVCMNGLQRSRPIYRFFCLQVMAILIMVISVSYAFIGAAEASDITVTNNSSYTISGYATPMYLYVLKQVK